MAKGFQSVSYTLTSSKYSQAPVTHDDLNEVINWPWAYSPRGTQEWSSSLGSKAAGTGQCQVLGALEPGFPILRHGSWIPFPATTSAATSTLHA